MSRLRSVIGLAATFVTTGIAVPILLAAAALETWVTPHLLLALAR